MKHKIQTIVIYLLIFAVTVLMLPSCTDKESSEKINILSTVFPSYDFSRVIGGDKVNSEMLLPPGADSHSYNGDNPTDIFRIMNCDIFIYVGGETDTEWVDKIKVLIENSSEKSPIFLSLCDVCDVLSEDDMGIIQNEELDSDEEGDISYDEHVWTSPKNAVKISEAICHEISLIDPDNSVYYTQNYDEYKSKLIELDSEFSDIVSSSDKNTLVFADRFPFRYFAEEFSLKCFAAFNGCASQSEPSPTTISKLCMLINKYDLKYVIYIETSRSGVPDAISKATGCGKILLHSCHAVTETELKNGETYLSLMNQNLINLRKALQ